MWKGAIPALHTEKRNHVACVESAVHTLTLRVLGQCHSHRARVYSAFLHAVLLRKYHKRKCYLISGTRERECRLDLSKINLKKARIDTEFYIFELKIDRRKSHHPCLTEFTEH